MPAVTYWNYLKLDKILNAQDPKSTAVNGQFEHDEMLFIIIHQVYELWFKQLIHELDYLRERLHANDYPRTLHTFRRMLTILKTVVAQVDVLETMTPLGFNAFRSFLDSASGFQSAQFREIEFILGHKREAMVHHFPEGSTGRERLQVRYRQPGLWDAFLVFLSMNGYTIPKTVLNRNVTEGIRSSPAIQSILIDIYRNDPILTRVCERMIDLDEGLQEWRYRHMKMVARTIGNKKGTGGSSGIKYLQTTLQPFFPDLWSIRAHL